MTAPISCIFNQNELPERGDTPVERAAAKGETAMKRQDGRKKTLPARDPKRDEALQDKPSSLELKVRRKMNLAVDALIKVFGDHGITIIIAQRPEQVKAGQTPRFKYISNLSRTDTITLLDLCLARNREEAKREKISEAPPTETLQ